MKNKIQKLVPETMFRHRQLYISTTLPYVNSQPHIGHAFEFVLADFLKRYYDLLYKPEKSFDGSVRIFPPVNSSVNQSSFLNTGIDEHGQKVAQKAIELNKKPQQYCDDVAQTWIKFCSLLQMDYNNFYRTTSENHKKLSQEFLFKIRDIIKLKEYSGRYCTGCESFKTEKEITNNECEYHPGLQLLNLTENNFTFPLSKFKNLDLSEILIDKTLQNELNSIIENFGEISISRESVDWGIDIPFSNQKMYVWFEALLNYVFAIGYKPNLIDFLNFSQHWKNSLIICGKDNLKFQAFILPAILSAAGIPAPHRVLVHGMILDDNGKKMSKSLGNVVDPVEQIEKFGINAVRYYFLAGLNTFQDSSYSESELINKYNSDLANNYGNLFARVTTIAQEIINNYDIPDDLYNLDIIKDGRYIGNKYNISALIHYVPESEFIKNANSEIEKAHTELQTNFNVKNCFSIVNSIVNNANKYYTENKPYDKLSSNRFVVLIEILYVLKNVSIFYSAATPMLGDFFHNYIEKPNIINKIILYPKINS